MHIQPIRNAPGGGSGKRYFIRRLRFEVETSPGSSLLRHTSSMLRSDSDRRDWPNAIKPVGIHNITNIHKRALHKDDRTVTRAVCNTNECLCFLIAILFCMRRVCLPPIPTAPFDHCVQSRFRRAANA